MPAERRRGEVRAAGGEACGLQSLGSPVERGDDSRRERGVADRDLAVALDEHEQDVLAAQAAQQPAGSGAAEAVVADLVGEDRVVMHPGLHRADLVGDQPGGTRGGDGRIRDDLRAQHPAEHPDDAERQDDRERPAAVAGCDPGQAKHRQRREDEHADSEHDRSGDSQVRLCPADRVAQGLDADPRVAPVGDRVEGAVEGLEEPHVEDLHDHQEAQNRSGDARHEALRAGRQEEGQRDEEQALEREPHERTGREAIQLVGSDEGDPDDEHGENGEHERDAGSHGAAPGAGVTGVRLRCGRASSLRGVAVAPQPGHVVSERLGEQRKRDEQGGLGQRLRQHVCSREREDDPLRRRDDLAPVARRQLLAQPWPHPPRCEERVACGADREHPRSRRAGDIHAEHGDQERVDLAVEARAQRRRRPRPSHDPSVDRVERERDDRQRHQQRDRRGPVERVRCQRGDADRERGPGERHPVGRAQSLVAVPGEAARECRIHDHGARDSDDPTGAAEADGPREGREQQRLGDQPGQRAGLNRSHRSSAFVATWGSTGSAAVRIHFGGGGQP